MNNIVAPRLTRVPRPFFNVAEQQFADMLYAMLSPPLKWDRDPAVVWVAYDDDAGFDYYPRFLIRSTATGRALAVELKTESALSLGNLMKLESISATFKGRGNEFLLLIEGGDRHAGIQRQVRDRGIRAVWLGENAEAEAIEAIRQAIAVPD